LVNDKPSTDKWLGIDDSTQTLTVVPKKDQDRDVSINFLTTVEGQDSGEFKSTSPYLSLKVIVSSADYNSLDSLEQRKKAAESKKLAELKPPTITKTKVTSYGVVTFEFSEPMRAP